MYLHLQFTKRHTWHLRTGDYLRFYDSSSGPSISILFFICVALSVSNRGDGLKGRAGGTRWGFTLGGPTALVRGLTYAEHSPRSVPSNDVYSSTPPREAVRRAPVTHGLTWLIVSHGFWQSALLLLLVQVLVRENDRETAGPPWWA